MHRLLATLSFALLFSAATNAGNKLGGNQNKGEIEIPITIEGEFAKLDRLIKVHMQAAYSKLEKHYGKKITSPRKMIALAITSSALFDVHQYVYDDGNPKRYFADALSIFNDIMQHAYKLERINEIRVDTDPNWAETSTLAHTVFEGKNFSTAWSYALKHAHNFKVEQPSRKEIENYIIEKLNLGNHPEQVLQLAYRFVLERMMESTVKFIGSSDFKKLNDAIMALLDESLPIDPLLNAFNLGKDAFFAKDEVDLDYLPGLKLISYKNSVPISFEEVSNSTETDEVHYHPHVGLPKITIHLNNDLFSKR